MRILFSACPMFGHVNPILPLVLAARDAGHDVVVATGPDLAARVASRAGGGVTTWAVGPSHEEAAGGPDTDWLAYFATTAHARAADLVPLALDWKPDLVVAEDTELAGPVAAAATGARHVVHGIGIMPPLPLWAVLGPVLDELSARYGTSAGGSSGGRPSAGRPSAGRPSAGHRAATYLELCPPSLRQPGEPIWRDTLPLRPVAGGPAPGERLPAAVDALPHERTVHVTLGTVFHGNRNVLHTAIAALSALPVNVVATVGPDVDPDGFGRQPAHVLLAPYLPHTLLLPRCAAVVSQGGAGITFGALAHGLPHLVLPQGGDQFMNAEAVELAGAGLALHPAEVTGAAIVAAVTRLLDEPPFRASASSIREEVTAMPSAAAVLATLTA